MSEPVEQSLPSEQNDLADCRESRTAVDTAQLLRIFEAALLTSQEPLSNTELKRLSDIPIETKFVEELLQQLADKYADQRRRAEPRRQRLALPRASGNASASGQAQSAKTAALFACRAGDAGDHCLSGSR